MEGGTKRLQRNGVIFVSPPEIGDISLCKSLFGKKVSCLAGGDAGILALCDDGCFNVVTGEGISPEKPDAEFGGTVGGVGKNSFSIVTPTGSIYSWGMGAMGELGLGPVFRETSTPLKVRYPSTFTSIASGEFHSAAIDTVGNLYTWGQNFDRQLALFTKDLNGMVSIKPNAMIEEVLYSPRIVPFSLKTPIAKVACGGRFTVALSKDGGVWTWGAGECGQLGAGRCTRRELPERVIISSTSKKQTTTPPSSSSGKKKKSTIIPMDEIACGVCHVIVKACDGSVYSWGLNTRGQLGLGDTTTRHQPQLIPEFSAQSLFAGGNSSAAIDASGQLFTWGSGVYGRLMLQDDINHQLSPRLVQQLAGCAVSSFAFTKTSSAALVFTRLFSLSPSSGPQKTFSRMEIHGCGFWDSDSIVVKFTSKSGSSFSVPRSCPGRLVSPGVIACKPPKLAEKGPFEVSVSLDGVSFVAEALPLTIFRDIVISSLSPRLVNLCSNNSKFQMIMGVKGLSVSEEDEGEVYYPVRLILTRSTPEGESTQSEIMVKGKLQPVVTSNNQQQQQIQEDDAASQGNSSQASASSNLTIHNIIVDVDLSFILNNNAESGIANSLVTLQAQVSSNGQDFSEPNAESEDITCHSFSAKTIEPSCYPYSSEPFLGLTGDGVRVLGESFLPAHRLPQNTTLEVVVQADIDFHGRKEVVIPVKCDSEGELTFIPPTVAQLMYGRAVPLTDAEKKALKASKQQIPKPTPRPKNATLPVTAIVEASVYFQLTSITMNDKQQMVPISQEIGTQRLNLTLYKPSAIAITPIFVRKSGGSELKISRLLDNGSVGGFLFPSSSARVVFRRSDLNYNYIVGEGAVSMNVDESNPPAAPAPSKETSRAYVLRVKTPSFMTKKKSRSEGNEGQDEEGEEGEEGEEAGKLGDAVDGGAGDEAQADNESLHEERSVSSRVSLPFGGSPPPEDISFIQVSVELDGVSTVDENLDFKLTLFDHIKIEAAPVPKGGAIPSTPTQITVQNIVEEMTTCIVRISGIKYQQRLMAEREREQRNRRREDKEIGEVGEGEEGDVPADGEAEPNENKDDAEGGEGQEVEAEEVNPDYVDVPGSIQFDAGCVNVTLPDSATLANIEPEIINKEKFYFASISVDNGITFDASTSPILQIKV